jgi:chromosome segregation ATPase
MKALKFKIISALLAGALVIPTVSAHAEGTTEPKLFGSGFVKQQQHLQTVKERQQYKPEMLEKKDTIKKNHETNKSLFKTISEKRAAVKAISKEIRESQKVLTTEDLDKIEAQLKIVQNSLSALQATKGTIKAAFGQFKTEAANKNYEAALAQLDNIINIQTARTAGLNKLSSDLDNLLELLKTASANASAAPSNS